MVPQALCKRCSRRLTPETTVRLWDGRDYCRQCVEKASPKLLAHALAHESLEEAMTYDRKQALRRALLMYAGIGALFWLFFAATGYREYGPFAILAGFLLACFGAGVAAAIQIPMFLWLTKRAVPKVCVRDGSITVFRPKQKALAQITVPLSQCWWYLGKLRGDSLLRRTLVKNAPAIIIVCSARWWFELCRYKTACGFSDETREIWQAFLRLAEIPEGRRRPKALRHASGLASAAR